LGIKDTVDKNSIRINAFHDLPNNEWRDGRHEINLLTVRAFGPRMSFNGSISVPRVNVAIERNQIKVALITEHASNIKE
jgi:hypothetical protein